MRAAGRGGERVELLHHRRERRRRERLVAVGQRALRIGMHLDDQTVGAGGDRGEGQRRDERRVAAGVARIDDDRQMRLALEHRNRRDVERVARRRLVGANAALAQHDVVIAVRHDVLGGH